MTRNLTIATLFLLASTLLLGYIWVRENSVLRDRTERFEGTLIAHGARDYEQYCASCHGLTGEGGVSAGAPQINNLPNTLGDRLEGPNGIVAKYGTVRNFVEATITSGVRGTAMPRWSTRLGGPLRDDQIRNVAAYIENWWGPNGANITADAAAAAKRFKDAAAQQASAGAPDTPVGRGGALYQANCASCHNLNAKDSGVPAPGLGGMFAPTGTAAFGAKLPNGKDVNPANFIEWVRQGGAPFKAQAIQPNQGFGPYIIEAMPPFPQFNDAQMADLIAFISTHDQEGNQSLPPIGGEGGAGAPAAAPAEPTAAPAAAAPTAAPAVAPGDNPLVAQGATVFQANCVACHTTTDKDSAIPAPGLGGLFGPDGTAAFGKLLPNGKDVTVANFIEWIKQGGAAFAGSPQPAPAAGFGPYQIVAMPAFAQLSDEQLAQLLAYLSTLDRAGNQTLPPLGVNGQPLQ